MPVAISLVCVTKIRYNRRVTCITLGITIKTDRKTVKYRKKLKDVKIRKKPSKYIQGLTNCKMFRPSSNPDVFDSQHLVFITNDWTLRSTSWLKSHLPDSSVFLRSVVTEL